MCLRDTTEEEEEETTKTASYRNRTDVRRTVLSTLRNWSVNYIHPLQKVQMNKQAGPRVTVLDFPCGPAPFSHEITLKKHQRRCQELHGPIDYSHGFKRERWALSRV